MKQYPKDKATCPHLHIRYEPFSTSSDMWWCACQDCGAQVSVDERVRKMLTARDTLIAEAQARSMLLTLQQTEAL